MSNSIFTIHPYKSNGIWMFDDESVGLVREAFVAGADDIIELATANMKNAYNGFNLLFSASPFPGYDYSLNKLGEEYGGNWYGCESLKMAGWLCPALFKYFDAAPDGLYIKMCESEEGSE